MRKMQFFSGWRQHLRRARRSQAATTSPCGLFSGCSCSSPARMAKKARRSGASRLGLRLRRKPCLAWACWRAEWRACWFSWNSWRERVRVLLRERVLFQFSRKLSLLLETSEISSGVSAEFLTISLHSTSSPSRSWAGPSRSASRLRTAPSVKEFPNYFLRLRQRRFTCPASQTRKSLSRARSRRWAVIFSGGMLPSKRSPISRMSSAIFLAKKSAGRPSSCGSLGSLSSPRVNLMMLVQQKQQISSKAASRTLRLTQRLSLGRALSLARMEETSAGTLRRSQGRLRSLRSRSLKVSTNSFLTRAIWMALSSPQSSRSTSRFSRPAACGQSRVTFSNISQNRLAFITSISLQVPTNSPTYLHRSACRAACSQRQRKQLEKRARQSSRARSWTGISENSWRTRRMSRWNLPKSLLEKQTVAVSPLTSMRTSSSSSSSPSCAQLSILARIYSSQRCTSTLCSATAPSNTPDSPTHSRARRHTSCSARITLLISKEEKPLPSNPHPRCTQWQTRSWKETTKLCLNSAAGAPLASQQLTISLRLRRMASSWRLNSLFVGLSLPSLVSLPSFSLPSLSARQVSNSLAAICSMVICLLSNLQMRGSMLRLILMPWVLWYSLPMAADALSLRMMLCRSTTSMRFCSTRMAKLRPGRDTRMQPGSDSTASICAHLQTSTTSGAWSLANSRKQRQLKSQGWTSSSGSSSGSSCGATRDLQESRKQQPLASLSRRAFPRMPSRLHCSATRGRHTNVQNPSAVNYPSRARPRAERDEEALESCGGEAVREESFLVLLWRLGSFLGSVGDWVHSLWLTRMLRLATHRSRVASSSALSSQMRFLVTSSKSAAPTNLMFLISWMGMVLRTGPRVSSPQQLRPSSRMRKQRRCQLARSPEERFSRQPRVLRACPRTFQLNQPIITQKYKNYHPAPSHPPHANALHPAPPFRPFCPNQPSRIAWDHTYQAITPRDQENNSRKKQTRAKIHRRHRGNLFLIVSQCFANELSASEKRSGGVLQLYWADTVVGKLPV